MAGLNIPSDAQGRFVRKPSVYRNWITADGSAGPTGEAGFRAEPGRYHLYVAYACPWAHRTLMLRSLKGLTEMIDVSVVNPYLGEHGWSFEEGEGVIPDPIHHARYLSDVYRADQHVEFDGHATTPLLWDKAKGRVVNNESSEIIRMFNSAFDAVGARAGDYYPAPLRPEIDAIESRIYDSLNNGVYRAGFAKSQPAYEEAVRGVFAMLDELEARLAQRRYLVGPQLTEADIRLFATLIRFDAVYVGHFKCNLRCLREYPALSGYTRDLFQRPDIRGTVHFDHIKRHYYQSHPHLNPSRIVPLGPELDFDTPHGREALA